jgi:HPt (histidine-containing phosphotransfer) domain-containing protein
MEFTQARQHGPLDRDHLTRMALGDRALEREVLQLFEVQASRLVDALATVPPDALALAHTLKGSARAIGAFEVADRAAELEAALKKGEAPGRALTELRDAVAHARAEIAAILKDPG